MTDIQKFLGSTDITLDNFFRQLGRYHSLRVLYNDLKEEVAIKELELELEQQRLIQSAEYDELKITEKRDRAKMETCELRRELIEWVNKKDDCKAELEVLQYFLKCCYSVGLG